jgi:stress-induced morphogen
MATVTRGLRDELLERVKSVLDLYEQAHPNSAASLYRQNSASVRIRIVDDRFRGLSAGDRHDRVWDFISNRLSEDDIQEISVLLLLAPEEQSSSFLNAEFNDPVPSSL